MKILMLFGSTSDEFIYGPLHGQLSLNHQVELKIISAHRQASKLEETLNTLEYDCILAGAGLAAHLPGVCASKTLKPVLGLPVSNQLDGLDALLSIQQMPAGIPVFTVGVNKGSEFVSFIQKVSMAKNSGYNRLNVVGGAHLLAQENVQKELTKIKELSIHTPDLLHFSSSVDTSAFNIFLVEGLNEDLQWSENLELNTPVVFVPIFSVEAAKDALSAYKLLSLTGLGGVWVGINNLRNAFLGLVQWINVEGRFDELLLTAKSGGKNS